MRLTDYNKLTDPAQYGNEFELGTPTELSMRVVTKVVKSKKYDDEVKRSLLFQYYNNLITNSCLLEKFRSDY